ncbi:hypothetical protein AVEN_204976-1, partial [Araneus ventricosus]
MLFAARVDIDVYDASGNLIRIAGCCAYQPVFGIPLEEHLKVTKREIAIVLETCVCWLLESAMEEE